MSDQPKDGFFRKVVRFVANPATEWTELNSRQDETRDLELEKSELKAMIERKRRNDFVRKREFDMLRKLRREGLSPEQLAALGGSSRIDDSEVRMGDTPARQDMAVKDKIDAIEQQMVGDGYVTGRQRLDTAHATTRPLTMHGAMHDSLPLPEGEDRLPALPPLPAFDMPTPAPAPVVMGGGVSPLAATGTAVSAPRPAPPAPGVVAPMTMPSDLGYRPPLAVEVSEVVHDPDLDEAVIAFANADFSQCETALGELTRPGGPRQQHAETWMVLFDLYRAIGQQPKFESLALDYAQLFGLSAPQWYSLPKLVAEAAAEKAERGSTPREVQGDVGWVCPPVLDTDAVARLRSTTLQLPLPWVFDWQELRRVEPEAASQLSSLMRQWAGQQLEMRWLGGEQFFTALQDAAPTGVRDADPAFWLLRLDALRLANRPDQFDETAIDYCVTYEVSPPSWESARCNLRMSGSSLSTRTPPMSHISEVSTSFLESSLHDDAGAGQQMASVELSGQLVGDISGTLGQLDKQLAGAPLVHVACGRLIRVDFIAAGDLLNWVLTKRSENRAVSFVDANRLVALFFGAMGINEHAKVQVRKV